MTRLRSSPGLGAMLAIGAAGVVALALGWHAVARVLAVSLQVPALVSGGMAGVALIGAACAFVDVQRDRQDAAAEAREVDAVLDEVAGIVAAVARRR